MIGGAAIILGAPLSFFFITRFLIPLVMYFIGAAVSDG
jgi:hypothetical protein